jgi:O-antigen ligase
VYFLIVILTPLSVQLIEYIPSLPYNLAIPTEPLLFGAMAIVFYKTLHQGIPLRNILNHPVTYAILFNVFWIFLTSVTSVLPLVSFKFLLARIWFVTVYYFLAVTVFNKTENIRRFIWCYSIPMLIVIVYAISRHIGYGLFDKEASHFVMNPFFRDHTSYGAVLAMLFFAVGGMVLADNRSILIRLFGWTVWMIITIALVLSYTRAAWISVLLGLTVYVVVKFKIRFRYILVATGILAVLFLGQQTEIIRKMKRNQQTSSATLSEHVQSISNITTDDSNLERINRWKSALRMFRERPVFGWGPGTYMFRYAPFQKSSDKTDISTDFGDLGNAHSEYIGPLAESGFPGSLSFLLIGLASLYTGFRVYRQLHDKKMKQLVLALVLGFITYLIHGTLNNFLDTDKASALFWGFSAVFVALDITLKKLNSENRNVVKY